MSFKKIMPLLIILVLFIIGPTYAIYMLGSAETGSSVNASYQGQFNGTRTNTITTLSIIKMISMIIGIVILIVAVGWITKQYRF